MSFPKRSPILTLDMISQNTIFPLPCNVKSINPDDTLCTSSPQAYTLADLKRGEERYKALVTLEDLRTSILFYIDLCPITHADEVKRLQSTKKYTNQHGFDSLGCTRQEYDELEEKLHFPQKQRISNKIAYTPHMGSQDRIYPKQVDIIIHNITDIEVESLEDGREIIKPMDLSFGSNRWNALYQLHEMRKGALQFIEKGTFGSPHIKPNQVFTYFDNHVLQYGHEALGTTQRETDEIEVFRVRAQLPQP